MHTIQYKRISIHPLIDEYKQLYTNGDQFNYINKYIYFIPLYIHPMAGIHRVGYIGESSQISTCM